VVPPDDLAISGDGIYARRLVRFNSNAHRRPSLPQASASTARCGSLHRNAGDRAAEAHGVDRRETTRQADREPSAKPVPKMVSPMRGERAAR
jgi:hypothetical protein